MAAGADLRPGTLLAAYRAGLFPMGLGRAGKGPMGWWSPDPRGILPLDGLRVSRSLRRSLGRFELRVDTDFDAVVAGCADPSRPGRWITPAVAAAYGELHRLGWAHSVECWRGGRARRRASTGSPSAGCSPVSRCSTAPPTPRRSRSSGWSACCGRTPTRAGCSTSSGAPSTSPAWGSSRFRGRSTWPGSGRRWRARRRSSSCRTRGADAASGVRRQGRSDAPRGWWPAGGGGRMYPVVCGAFEDVQPREFQRRAESVGRPALRSHEVVRAQRGSRRRAAVVAAGVGAALLLSGCENHLETGWLPSTPTTTNQTGRIISLWNGSWIAAWLVGFLVWGLIIWCVVAYRRRRNETGLPAQIRYNLPLEIMYTVIPLIMIAVLFFFTARDEAAIADVSAKPDVTINVVGKQWAWDFNYLQQNGQALNVYEPGRPGPADRQAGGRVGAADALPAGGAARAVRADVARRHPLVLDPRLPLQAGRHPRRPEQVPGRAREDRVLQGQVRRALRRVPLRDALQRPGGLPGRLRRPHQQLRSQGHVGTLDSNLGRSYTPPGAGAVPGGTTNGVDGTGSK